ncbi:MAG: hypothetical protein KatS3mg132_885 [Limisphaera sp.]|nr:MAG: hypothetical protein KatS3mg132_885 [Limisphaera sp.]
MNPSDRVRQIVEEYRARLQEILGAELEAVVLYGSQARGDAEAGSDIDVLCVMRARSTTVLSSEGRRTQRRKSA